MKKDKCFNCGGKIKPKYSSMCEKCNEKMLKTQDNIVMLDMIKKWGLEWFESREKWAKRTYKKSAKKLTSKNY